MSWSNAYISTIIKLVHLHRIHLADYLYACVCQMLWSILCAYVGISNAQWQLCWRWINSPFSAAVVSVLVPPKPCQEQRDKWIITDIETGLISNTVAIETKCATESLPLEIRGLPGQRINVTFFDFNTPFQSPQSMQYDSNSHTQCDEFANLVDHFAKKKTKLCPSTERMRHAYTSTNETLQVFFKKMPSSKRNRRFLIQFEGKRRDMHTDYSDVYVNCVLRTFKLNIAKCLKNKAL